MKRTIWLSISAIVLAAAVVIPVIAQPPQGGGERGPGRGMGPGAPFLRELNLTDAQREQIRALTEQRRGQGDNPRRKVADLERQLQVAVFADAPDQQKIDDLKKAVAAATAEELTARVELQSHIAEILTPEQRAHAREALGKIGGRGGPAGVEGGNSARRRGQHL
jgi:Spy/CpxP family protein refolding chaperone